MGAKGNKGMEEVVEKWYEEQLGIAVSLYPRF